MKQSGLSHIMQIKKHLTTLILPNLHLGIRIAKINIFGREMCKIQAEHLKRNACSLLDVFTKRPFTA